MKSGEIIKQILKEKGLKISWLAEQLKIKNSTLSTRLNRDLKVDFTLKICKVLKISLNDVYIRYKESMKEN